MRCKKLATVGLGLFIFAANSATAAGYVSGTIGKADYDIDGFDKGTSFAITLGYKVNENLALEGSYIDLGDAEDDWAPVWTVSTDGLAFAVRGIAPVSPTVELYGKVGMYMWDVSVKEEGFGEFYSNDGSDIFFGAGISFAVNEQFDLMAEYTRFEVDDEDVSNMSLGLRVNF